MQGDPENCFGAGDIHYNMYATYLAIFTFIHYVIPTTTSGAILMKKLKVIRFRTWIQGRSYGGMHEGAQTIVAPTNNIIN